MIVTDKFFSNFTEIIFLKYAVRLAYAFIRSFL